MKKTKTHNTEPLLYHIKSIKDILDPFSLNGKELIHEDFISFLKLNNLPHQKSSPTIINIYGIDIDAKMQQRIEKAIISTQCLKLKTINQAIKKNFLRILWFTICFIISSVLLYFVNSDTPYLWVNCLYFPFWFFGYRLLTIPFFEFLPNLQDRKNILNYSSATWIFSKDPIKDANSPNLTHNDSKKKLHQIKAILKENNTINNKLELSVGIFNINNIIRASSHPGQALLTSNFEEYLCKITPIVPKTTKIKCNFINHNFNKTEQTIIEQGIRNDFNKLSLKYKEQIKNNQIRTWFFLICLAIVTVIIYLWSDLTEVAVYECLIIQFWFFGDTAIENILITQNDLHAMKRKVEALKVMTLNFKNNDIIDK